MNDKCILRVSNTEWDSNVMEFAEQFQDLFTFEHFVLVILFMIWKSFRKQIEKTTLLFAEYSQMSKWFTTKSKLETINTCKVPSVRFSQHLCVSLNKGI